MAGKRLFWVTILLSLALTWSRVFNSACGGVQYFCRQRNCMLDKVRDRNCLLYMVNELQYNDPKILKLNRLDVEGLPSGMFNVTKIHTLHFKSYSKNILNSADVNPFLGLENHLKEISFMNATVGAEMHKWHWKHLSSLKLEHIIITETVFHPKYILPKNFSEAGSSSINTLQITSSCLNTLEGGSLSTFTNVTKINLSGNRLTFLSRSVFPSNAPLEIIDLSQNHFYQIKTNFDKPMFWNPKIKSLREVYFDDNQIENIYEFLFTDNLIKFRLNGNPLDCDEDLAWILKKNVTLWQRPEGEPVVCHRPECLRGRLLSSLTEANLEGCP